MADTPKEPTYNNSAPSTQNRCQDTSASVLTVAQGLANNALGLDATMNQHLNGSWMSLAELQDRILGYLRLDLLEVESGQAE